MLHDQSQNVTGTSNKMLHNNTSYINIYNEKKNIKKKNSFDNYSTKNEITECDIKYASNFSMIKPELLNKFNEIEGEPLRKC